MAAAGSNKAIFAALFANLGIAITKFGSFLLTGSTAMLAESVHSLADTGNQGLLILGGKRAAREPTPAHPFGHGRERYFWAFVVSIILFSLGSLFAIYEGVHKLQHIEPLESPAYAIGTLTIGIVLEFFSFRTAIVEAIPHKGRASWMDYIRNSRSPELPVVLLEDAGAMIGLVLALAAVVTAAVTGNGVWDGIGSLAIGFLLGVIAIVLAIEMKSLLIGETASSEQEELMRRLMVESKHVRGLIWLRTQHLGPDELLVAAKLEFDASLDMLGLARAINGVEARVRAEVPTAEYLFIEPDVRRAAESELPVNEQAGGG
jgi:cation diffusion facilitator family transporter